MKKWYQSKTIWLNILAGILGIVPVIDGNLLIAMGIFDTARWLVILGSFTTVLNIVFRVLTNKGIDTTSRK